MEPVTSTQVKLPSTTIFPVVITALLNSVGDEVTKHSPILRFKYWNFVEELSDTDDGEEPKRVEKEFYSTFEVPIDGELSEWNVTIGQEIENSS